MPGKIDYTVDRPINCSATHQLSSEGASLGSKGPPELEDLCQAPHFRMSCVLSSLSPPQHLPLSEAAGNLTLGSSTPQGIIV